MYSIDYLLKPIEPARLTRADKMERRRTARPDIRALERELDAELAPTAGWSGRVGVGERTPVLEVARSGHSRRRTS